MQSPAPVKSRPVDPGAFNDFLARNMAIASPIKLNITDMKEWKKRMRVEPSSKVFIISANYRDVKKALKRRGWVQNKDTESPCFDLIWRVKNVDIPHKDLQPHQICNHFQAASIISTKVGLTHSLRNLIWFNAVDIDTFYPRCYDLASVEEVGDFI